MSDSPPLNSKVVVGRRWHEPSIYAMVSVDKVEMTMDLGDLVRIVANEMESAVEKELGKEPWYALTTRWGLRKRLQKLDLSGLVKRVTDEAVDEMKKASVSVV